MEYASVCSLTGISAVRLPDYQPQSRHPGNLDPGKAELRMMKDRMARVLVCWTEREVVHHSSTAIQLRRLATGHLACTVQTPP